MDAVDVARLALAHLSPAQAVTAVAIAKAESNFNPSALGDTTITNDVWGPSIGLWQIRSMRAQWGSGLPRDGSRLEDPAHNARAMTVISKSGTYWQPWSVYKNGRYQTWMPLAQSAVGEALRSRWRLSGDGWRVAHSIETLAYQLTAVWPDAAGVDGTLGDASHAARRSDHNPNTRGVVRAIDVGETVEGQGQQLVDALVASRDPRILYIIHEGRIWRSYPKPGIPAWTPAPYTGVNPHASHVHISVSTSPALYDDPQPWRLDLAAEDDMELVKNIQKALVAAGYDLGDFGPDGDGVDGVWGARTQAALESALSKKAGLPASFEATVTVK